MTIFVYQVNYLLMYFNSVSLFFLDLLYVSYLVASSILSIFSRCSCNRQLWKTEIVSLENRSYLFTVQYNKENVFFEPFI